MATAAPTASVAEATTAEFGATAAGVASPLTAAQVAEPITPATATVPTPAAAAAAAADAAADAAAAATDAAVATATAAAARAAARAAAAVPAPAPAQAPVLPEVAPSYAPRVEVSGPDAAEATPTKGFFGGVANGFATLGKSASTLLQVDRLALVLTALTLTLTPALSPALTPALTPAPALPLTPAPALPLPLTPAPALPLTLTRDHVRQGGEASPGKSPAKGFIDGMIERKRLADEISEIDKDTEEATVSALAVAKQARGVAYLRS
jgi:hypothetical protein